jgi:predicted neuraminidase
VRPINIFYLSCCIVAFSGSKNNLLSQTAVVRSEFIFEQVPFESCHASTIIETESGLLAAWFAGTNEGNMDVEIWLSRFENGKWSQPVSVANGIQNESTRFPCWNPVLMRFPDFNIRLFYKVGPNPREWWGEYLVSDDEGKTWATPEKLPDGFLGPVKNKGIVLNDMVIISPSSTEHDGWRVHFERSNDRGKTWELIRVPEMEQSVEGIQPSILIHSDGKLQAVCRTKTGFIAETWSNDNGFMWNVIKPTTLPNPNSGIDGLTLKDGRHLLVYNHARKPEGKWGGLRTPLNVSVSSDGKEWEACLVLESDPGEYSYPAVIQTKNKSIHITYTWNRKKIKHVLLDPAFLISNPITN